MKLWDDLLGKQDTVKPVGARHVELIGLGSGTEDNRRRKPVKPNPTFGLTEPQKALIRAGIVQRKMLLEQAAKLSIDALAKQAECPRHAAREFQTWINRQKKK